MAIQFNFIAPVDAPLTWRADWAWGAPLIVLTVLIHVLGLGATRRTAVRVLRRSIERRRTTGVFVVVVGTATVLVTFLHAIEAMFWAIAYYALGAIASYRMAMLYSLNAMTSYGHTNITLEDHWHLLGAIEALNGWILFGLTTAFLYSIIETVWMQDRR